MGPLSRRLQATKDFTTMKILLFFGLLISISGALSQEMAVPLEISQDDILREDDSAQPLELPYQERITEPYGPAMLSRWKPKKKFLGKKECQQLKAAIKKKENIPWRPQIIHCLSLNNIG